MDERQEKPSYVLAEESMDGPRVPQRGNDERWRTIRYALGSWPRTARLSLIVLVTSTPPGVLVWLLRREPCR